MAARVASGSENERTAAPLDYRPCLIEYAVNQLVNRLLNQYKESGTMFCHDVEVTSAFGITYLVTTTFKREGSMDQGRIESIIKDLAGNLIHKTVYLCKNKTFVLEDQEAEARAKEDEDTTDSDEAAAAAAGPPEGSSSPGGAAAAAAGNPAAGAASDRRRTTGTASPSSAAGSAGGAGKL